jgi:hypothetical protein
MSNQIDITGGARVRGLNGVITGTTGVLSSLPINTANGIPQLDSSGKILVSQLPNSVMEFLGTWNAATNTPTLANGTGNAGDVYLCNVAGTVNFGAGPIAFIVGDYVVYSGSTWERSGGAVGTVTSVALTESGDSLTITGSPVTTSGTINIGFAGTNLQYINGAGNLTTFPILTGFVPYTGATANVDLGTFNLTADVITGATGSFASNGGSDTFAINHSSGSGIALNITKGGAGEGLYINKTSGSGNAATIIGTLNATTLVKSGGTSSQYLMADGSVSTLTNPVTGTGTTNTLPKFTAASTIGNSNITDTGSLITLGSNTSIANGGLGIGQSALTGYNLRIGTNITGATTSYGIFNSSSIQSDVTTTAIYNRTVATTQAASFTLSNIYHYFASQGTFGAGSSVTTQIGFFADNGLIGATANIGFYGLIPAALNRWNLFMGGTAANFLLGDTGIGSSSNFVSSGPILTTTLTNGGSGYVDGTYTDVASTNISATINADYALFTIVVISGIVTTATLTWGGTSYRAGDTLTVSNTLLGGTGSGLVITVNTVDSSQLTIASLNGGDITLFRNDTSLSAGENIGRIKWGGRDSSAKSSGLYAEIGAFSAGTLGGAYLSFLTRSVSAGTSLVEAMRIDARGNVGIGATALTRTSLSVSKNITGSTLSIGIGSDGVIQSDVTSQAYYFLSASSTAAASFTLGTLFHYRATQGTFGAGSIVTTQYGFNVDNLTGATNNYGFFGGISSGTNKWNLYMNGTAANYMAGVLNIGTTTLSGYTLDVNGTGRFSSNFYVSGGTNTNVGNGIHAYYESNYAQIQLNGATGSIIDFSTSGTDFLGRIVYTNATNQFEFKTNSAGTAALTIASTGAATFSSSVTTNANNYFNNTSGRAFDATSDGVLMAKNGGAHNIIFGDGNVRYYSLYTPSGAATMSIRNFSTSLDMLTFTSTGAATFSSSVSAGSTISTSDGFYSSKTGSDSVGSGAYLQLANNAFIQANASNGLDFWTLSGSWQRRMTITQGGNVGIGTSSPTTYSLSGKHLELFGGGDYAFIHNNTTTVKSFYAINEAALTAVLFTFSAHPLCFGTSNTERMRLSGANLLIGTTTNATGLVQVNGTVYATGFYESSDIRFKNILETNPNINLSAIDVIKFTRKDNDINQVRYGYSAQQVQSILPDAVTGSEFLNVNYLDVHTLKIAQLEKEIKELKAKLN